MAKLSMALQDPLITKSISLSRFKLLAIPFALTLTLGGGVIWYVFDSYNAFKKVQSEDLKIQELSGEIVCFDETLTSSARLAVATGELNWEKRYRKAETALDAAITEVRKLAPDVFEGASFTQTSLANEKLVALENQAFQLLQQGQRQQAAALLSSSEYQEQKEIYSKGLEATTTALKETVNETILARGKQAFSTIIFVVVSLAILLIAWVFVLRILVRYVQTLSETQQIIVTTASGLAASIEQQERTTTDQAASVNQTTTAMDELGTSSRWSAEQAEAAASGAAQVLVLVQGDRQNNQDNTDSLQAKVGQIAEQFRNLNEQTRQIGTISTLVSQLASQTNMLALNAAVEAVRAGEHGKGFAVVATEIRKLADQSKQSAEQINNLVQNIQNATNKTMITTDEGRKTVEHVVDAVNGIAMNTRQISLTVQQQAIAIQQVLEAMNTINQGASDAAVSIAQTKVETQKLNNAAMNLQAVV